MGKVINVISEPYSTALDCGINYHVNLYGVLDSEDDYSEVFNLLVLAENIDNINFHFDTTGGDLDLTLKLISLMDACSATITGCLVGKAYSAGSLLFLSCDQLNVLPLGVLLVHTPTVHFEGSLMDAKAFVKFTEERIKTLMIETYLDSEFLTQEEFDLIFESNKDFYYSAEEIRLRLQGNDKY